MPKFHDRGIPAQSSESIDAPKKIVSVCRGYASADWQGDQILDELIRGLDKRG